ncbi:hypothetical protein LTR91_002471 [Friedmanniomyces endolithicus]|uniref:Carbohydrate kinase PfkB domain-containing protein n=1 Tax=Friedmanniomyces endolithicus TaxID=329885 RepID=A0A4U0UIG8_9PEZI|nr:hypothetical protein LTS09_013298 [Friedmanniomyces endolithicus]KAK0275994.1 hypothetical protein LTR35_010763 [Friedmanniomyces endolithicus]KAK0292440.1 hypothetical protein LTS00_007917 [Friedmanniomyces endolithicus]KAK0919564.1 hypothetical protein LTR57_010561 [Friedmanniomyces endolithicus]KAK0998386.1 hypothetical protein LTR54_009524 [Friedmanniomyces endolithicus]
MGDVEEMEAEKLSSIDFVTLGMFIIDDIYPPPSAPNQTPQKDIIGGAGTYSALGARLFSPPPTQSKTVAWIIDAGTDFPATVRSQIESWETSALIRPREVLTTRGWNGYGENESRAFKYLTEKKRLTVDGLSPEFLSSRSFHLICSPLRCTHMIQQILAQRAGNHKSQPVIIWEPVPDLCVPSELPNTLQAMQHVQVISPNHEELGSLFSQTHPAAGVDRALVENHAHRLLDSGIGPNSQGAVVVRAGKEGCYIASHRLARWLPAYHQDSRKVVDPTGGGNGFLGGLAVGLARTGSVVEAARWGSVAASYCIEQVGVPAITCVHDEGTGVVEEWNGSRVEERLEEFRGRTG